MRIGFLRAKTHKASEITEGKFPLERLADAVCSETEAAAIAATTALAVSDTVRNSNDTSQTISTSGYVKKKECKLNADLSVCRIKFTIGTRRTDGQAGTKCQIYKNGSPLGTERSKLGGNGDWVYETFSEDFAGFVTNDLIQIYGKWYNNQGEHLIKDMQFCYSENITHIGGKELETPLPDAADPTISITNQDP